MADIQALLRESAERVRQMSPEEREAMWEAQRRSFVRAEIGFGSDKDEAAYRSAVTAGDEAEMAQLDREAAERIRAAGLHDEEG